MTTSLYFIDSRVADIEDLVAALPADSLWYLLDETQDGIEQIRAIVAGCFELQSIHIVSHGVSGSVLLGSTWLSSQNLQDHAAALAQIGSSLSADGDLLLYVCNLAQGDAGLQLINQLTQFTRAKVAGSIDLTGLGGNSGLETTSGVVGAAALSPANYSATLDVITGDNAGSRLYVLSGEM